VNSKLSLVTAVTLIALYSSRYFYCYYCVSNCEAITIFICKNNFEFLIRQLSTQYKKNDQINGIMAGSPARRRERTDFKNIYDERFMTYIEP
jgi:hypothetical protein